LARPGGNTTGFTTIEYGFSAKYLGLLKEIAPRITQAAVIRDPTVAAQIGQMGAIQSVAPSLGVELRARSRRVTPARSSARSRHSRASAMAV
jgi:putative ABC transport system substrate-binding protein